MELYEADKQVRLWLEHIKNELIPMRSDDLGYSTKKNYRDLVTAVDKNVEKYLRERIEEYFPEAEIIGEESTDGCYQTSADEVWLIDPIDGTANFVKQREDYCIMLACFEQEKPMLAYIYNVHRDELTSAVRGKGVFVNGRKLDQPKNIGLKDAMISADIRRMAETVLCTNLIEKSFDLRYIGSAGLDAAKVASGCFGGYFSPMAGGPWDFAPMILIAEELGLHLSTWDGQPLSIHRTTSFVLCTEQIYEDVREFM